MLVACAEEKVLAHVVRPNPVDVMNFLPGFQHPAQLGLDYHPVLVDPSPKSAGVLRDPDHGVTVL